MKTLQQRDNPMHSDAVQNDEASDRRIWFPGGRIYFSRDSERRFFFIMMLGMAVLAIAVRFGWI